jgi:hypothetical protein
LGFAAGVVNGLVYAVGGANSDGKTLTTVEAYSPSSNSWSIKAPLPSARALLNGAGTINGVLYVAGGMNSNEVETNTLFVYNPATNTWTTKAPMLKAGGCGASGVIGGKLYVYTGCKTTTAAFQRYDPATNSWKTLAPHPVPTAYPTAGVIDGKFYLAGGSDESGGISQVVAVYDPATNTWGGAARDAHCARSRRGSRHRRPLVSGGRTWGATREPVAAVEVYDPRSSTWYVRPSMPTPREDLASAALNGKLYAIGGYANGLIAANEVYTPGDLWLSRSRMPTALESFAAAVVGGKFYAIGGRSNGILYGQNLACDPGTNRWASRARMPKVRAASNGAGVINGIIYVPGGHSGDGIPTRSLYAYNPATNTWSSKNGIPAAIGCGGSGAGRC